MKLTALVVAVVAFSTTEAFSQCDVVRDVAKTQLNQYLERIKERVSGDADEMFHSEYVQNSLRPDANNGRPYHWIGDRRVEGNQRTYMNIYRQSSTFARTEIKVWSGGERDSQLDASPDVLSLSEMINSIRSANRLRPIAIHSVGFQQGLEPRGELKFDQITIQENPSSRREVNSIEELTERYMLPSFCRPRINDVSVNTMERQENKSTSSYTYSSSSSSSSSTTIEIRRSSTRISNQ